MRFAQPLLAVVLVGVLATGASAEWMPPGVYGGRVIFDRWGGCVLFNGTFLIYVSEGVKERLRSRDGKLVDVRATSIDQPYNPGDGRIVEFRELEFWEKSAGYPRPAILLRAAPVSAEGEPPNILLTVENLGGLDAKVASESLAVTVFTRKSSQEDSRYGYVSDGPSFAWINGASLWPYGFEAESMSGNSVGPGKRIFTWSSDVPLQRSFMLKPGEKRKVTLQFDLPRGEYDFLAGHGDTASNLLSFDVDQNGRATFIGILTR